MKKFAFTFWLLMVPLPALAQEIAPPTTLDETLDRLRAGADALLRQFMQEMEPAVRDLAPFLQDLTEFTAKLPSYHPPEILPNGDILLRRRAPAPDQDYESAPDTDNTSPSAPVPPIEL